MKNTNAFLGLESFKGEKVVTYFGLLVSIATITLLYIQFKENRKHMALQSELAKEQLRKLKIEG